MATRRYGTIVRHLTDDPDTAVELSMRLNDDVLAHLAAALADEARRRATEAGDHDAIIDQAFDEAFGRDGLGCNPWIEGAVIVCPGGMTSKKRGAHVCRFVSVDDTWIWDSMHLIEERKRSSPGNDLGFRAVALLPIVEGLKLDVVHGRQRGGGHQVNHVTSYIVKRGSLNEVSSRDVSPRRGH